MLVKGNDVIGKKVITLDTGKHIDNVADLVYVPENTMVKALLIDAGGWFSDAKVILYEDVRSIGDDAVMVDSESSVKRASDVPENVAHIARDDTYLTKTRIVTEEGTDLGKVNDIYFEDKTGKVEAFEVTQGLKDIQSGHKRVRVSDIVTVGKDATIVRGYTEEIFRDQASEQGIQGVLKRGTKAAKSAVEKGTDAAKSKSETAKGASSGVAADAVNTAQSVGQKVDRDLQTLAGQVREKVTGVKEDVGARSEEAREKISENRRKDALGQYLTVNILDTDDSLIASRGDMVTNEVIERADKAGLLEKVLANTSKEPLVSV